MNMALKFQKRRTKGIDPQKFCDEISQTFKDLLILKLTNTDFIRTTEERHKTSVKHLWKKLGKK